MPAEVQWHKFHQQAGDSQQFDPWIPHHVPVARVGAQEQIQGATR